MFVLSKAMALLRDSDVGMEADLEALEWRIGGSGRLEAEVGQPRIAPQRSSSRLAGWLPDWGGRPSTKEDEVDEAVAKSSLASMLVSTLTTFALKAASTYVMNHYIKGGERQR